HESNPDPGRVTTISRRPCAVRAQIVTSLTPSGPITGLGHRRCARRACMTSYGSTPRRIASTPGSHSYPTGTVYTVRITAPEADAGRLPLEKPVAVLPGEVDAPCAGWRQPATGQHVSDALLSEGNPRVN